MKQKMFNKWIKSSFQTDEPESLHYGIGDVGAGWYRKIEDRRQKLWYFGALKRRWAYIWEMIKVGVPYLQMNGGQDGFFPFPCVPSLKRFLISVYKHRWPSRFAKVKKKTEKFALKFEN